MRENRCGEINSWDEINLRDKYSWRYSYLESNLDNVFNSHWAEICCGVITLIIVVMVFTLALLHSFIVRTTISIVFSRLELIWLEGYTL